MKNSEIVANLVNRLPEITDKFTDVFGIVSMMHSGTTVTVETDQDHDLSIGNGVYLTGVNNLFELSSIERDSEGILTVKTVEAHDLTNGSQETVSLRNAGIAGFNGDFPLVEVLNRYTFTLSGGPTTGPTTDPNPPQALDVSSVLQSYNGLFPVATVPSSTTFTYEVGFNSGFGPEFSSASVRTNIRISSAITVDRIIDSYTKQPLDKYYLFSVLEDTIASKDQNTTSDATANIPRQNYMRQTTIEQFHLYLVIPCSDQIGAAQARDEAQEMFPIICKGILFLKIDSGLHVGKQYPVMFNSHGPEGYTPAFYIHRYTFEQSADLNFEDTVGYDEDVAFRDLDFSLFNNVGGEPMTADINLDEDPSA